MIDYLSLVDGVSAAIVLGGTALATVLRCGLRECMLAVKCLFGSLGPRFNAEGARANLALQIQAIQQDGIFRAEPHRFADEEFNEMADALIAHRSLESLPEQHRKHMEHRLSLSRSAANAFTQAATLAPVFGLAGTLVALSQLPGTASAGVSLSASIPAAITTTLYGLMAANLIFAPLAQLITRRAEAEERDRQTLIDWLTKELSNKGLRPSQLHERAAA